MKRKMICPTINKEIYLTFDIVKAATMENPRQYLIGLISNCSACKSGLCEKCQLAQVLYNQPINL